MDWTSSINEYESTNFISITNLSEKLGPRARHFAPFLFDCQVVKQHMVSDLFQVFKSGVPYNKLW